MLDSSSVQFASYSPCGLLVGLRECCQSGFRFVSEVKVCVCIGFSSYIVISTIKRAWNLMDKHGSIVIVNTMLLVMLLIVNQT